MIFRIFTMRRPHKASYGKIETRGAILAFIVSIRRKFHYLISWTTMLQYMLKDSVDIRITLPTPLVRHMTGIADAGQDDPMTYEMRSILIAS